MEEMKTSETNGDNISIDTTTFPTPPSAITPDVAYTLEEAYKKFGSDLPVPSYLPEGYAFQYALYYGEPDGRTSLIYEKGDEELRITQLSPPDKPCPGALTGEAVKVTIDGIEGTFISDDGKNQLQWSNENFSYWLTAMLDKDEMVKVAFSIE